MNAVETVAFKRGMRKLASSVTILTTDRNGQKGGLTATAVTSLSLDPPSLLACVNRDSLAHSLLVEGGNLCVNILATDQVKEAEIFSTPDLATKRFELVNWTAGTNGAPVLSNAAVSFLCEIHRIEEAFTHSIVIARVVETIVNDKEDLIYEDASYGRFTPLND